MIKHAHELRLGDRINLIHGELASSYFGSAGGTMVVVGLEMLPSAEVRVTVVQYVPESGGGKSRLDLSGGISEDFPCFDLFELGAQPGQYVGDARPRVAN